MCKLLYPKASNVYMTSIKHFLFHLIIVGLGLLIAFNSLPIVAFAAEYDDTKLEVAGWLPYWRDSESIESAEDNLEQIDSVYPFVFTVRSDGTLSDQADIDEDQWEDFFEEAQDERVEVIPTIMWSDSGAIHNTLSYDHLREAHIEEIVDMVEDGDFDGVDIDYENKLSSTKDHFSAFLEELKEELDDKLLVCTIEARTPPESLWQDVPETILRANDYDEIAEHCDRVQLMTYDQQRADLKLNEEKAGEPYMPVSDVDWVEKVVELALEDIPEDKLMLGIPTYGHHYTVTVAPNWYKAYDRIGALNVPGILEVAEEYDVEPGRNKAGEMSFSYFPDSSIYKVLNSLPTPEDTREGFEAAAKALLFANLSGHEAKFNLAWYSDAGAIEDKIALAAEYGLRGVSLFKIDGDEDEDLWDLFE